MHRLSVVAVTAALALAGCLGGSETGSPFGPQGGVEEGAGTIIGLVLDDQQLPVAGATAVLDGDERSETGGNGTFTFTGVSPGAHTISVAKTGFQDKEAEVEVTRGARTEVQIQLLPVGVEEPFHQTHTFNGLIGCNVNVADQEVTFFYATCEAFYIAGLHNIDNYIGLFPAVPLIGATGYWGETVWDSTQAFGASLHVYWAMCGGCVPDQNTYVLYPYYDSAGTSPLRQRIPMDIVDTYLEEYEPQFCEPESCLFTTSQFSGAEGPAGAPVGILLQQRFEQFMTMFYNGPLPDEFTVIPDQ